MKNDNVTECEVYTEEDQVSRHERLQNESVTRKGEKFSPSPKNHWAFNIQEEINTIIQSRENVQVTFFHRFVYQQDDPRVLKAIHERLTRKLAYMGVLPDELKEPNYDETALEFAIYEFENGNPKFYSTASTGKNFNRVGQE